MEEGSPTGRNPTLLVKDDYLPSTESVFWTDDRSGHWNPLSEDMRPQALERDLHFYSPDLKPPKDVHETRWRTQAGVPLLVFIIHFVVRSLSLQTY